MRPVLLQNIARKQFHTTKIYLLFWAMIGSQSEHLNIVKIYKDLLFLLKWKQVQLTRFNHHKLKKQTSYFSTRHNVINLQLLNCPLILNICKKMINLFTNLRDHLSSQNKEIAQQNEARLPLRNLLY